MARLTSLPVWGFPWTRLEAAFTAELTGQGCQEASPCFQE